MKWNIACASLIASVALCTQSFGFDLLDRMLGGSGCGCEVKCCETAASCCDTDPSCGCDIVDPSCGCNVVDPGCCVTDPSCGCQVAGDGCCDPCASSCGGRKPLIQINLPKLFKRGKKGCCDSGCGDAGCCDSACDPCCNVDPTCGCDVVDPSCGCNVVDPSCGCQIAGDGCCDPCASSCGKKKRGGLLDRIFSGRKKKGCCEISCCEPTCGAAPCGCGSVVPAADHGDQPMPPAPIVDDKSSAFVVPSRVIASH